MVVPFSGNSIKKESYIVYLVLALGEIESNLTFLICKTAFHEPNYWFLWLGKGSWICFCTAHFSNWEASTSDRHFDTNFKGTFRKVWSFRSKSVFFFCVSDWHLGEGNICSTQIQLSRKLSSLWSSTLGCLEIKLLYIERYVDYIIRWKWYYKPAVNRPEKLLL